MKFPAQIYEHCKQYLNGGTYTYTNAQLTVRRGGKELFLNIQCEVEGYYRATDTNNEILGVDRGGILNNIVLLAAVTIALSTLGIFAI